MNGQLVLISVKDWLATKGITLPVSKLRALGREVASLYKHDRVDKPLKVKKVCVYDVVKDNGILEKALTTFLCL